MAGAEGLLGVMAGDLAAAGQIGGPFAGALYQFLSASMGQIPTSSSPATQW